MGPINLMLSVLGEFGFSCRSPYNSILPNRFLSSNWATHLYLPGAISAISMSTLPVLFTVILLTAPVRRYLVRDGFSATGWAGLAVVSFPLFRKGSRGLQALNRRIP